MKRLRKEREEELSRTDAGAGKAPIINLVILLITLLFLANNGVGGGGKGVQGGGASSYKYRGIQIYEGMCIINNSFTN